MITLFHWTMRAALFVIILVAVVKFQSTFVGHSNEPSILPNPGIKGVSLIEPESVNEPRQVLAPYESQVTLLDDDTPQNLRSGNAAQGNAAQGNAAQGNAAQGNAAQGNAAQVIDPKRLL